MSTKSAKEKAYDKAYEATPEQKKKRAMRNAARAAYEKVHGKLPTNVEVDHKKMLDSGGTNDPANLRAIPAAKNRGWRKQHPKAHGKG